MKKCFIARKYVAIEGGARHYYEEGIFDSYKNAYDFIIDISEEDEDFFLSEIVSYPLNSGDPDDQKDVFTYDRKGDLLFTVKAENKYDDCYVVEKNGNRNVHPKRNPSSFSGQYKIGDVVFIKAFPWNSFSPTHKDTIGVVTNVPQPFEKWVESGNEKYTWDNTYVVSYIRNGYLGHWHVEEKGLVDFDGVIPSKLKFLNVLSDHYKGNKVLNSALIQEINYGNVFLEDVKHFCFGDDSEEL